MIDERLSELSGIIEKALPVDASPRIDKTIPELSSVPEAASTALNQYTNAVETSYSNIADKLPQFVQDHPQTAAFTAGLLATYIPIWIAQRVFGSFLPKTTKVLSGFVAAGTALLAVYGIAQDPELARQFVDSYPVSTALTGGIVVGTELRCIQEIFRKPKTIDDTVGNVSQEELSRRGISYADEPRNNC